MSEFLNQYKGPFNQHVDMSTAIKVPCPVCAAHYYGVCSLCNGCGVALRLPSGALFPVSNAVSPAVTLTAQPR